MPRADLLTDRVTLFYLNCEHRASPDAADSEAEALRMTELSVVAAKAATYNSWRALVFRLIQVT